MPVPDFDVNEFGDTHMKIAIDNGDQDTVRALVAAGVSIQGPMDNRFHPGPAFPYAVQREQVACVQALLELGADIEQRNAAGYTPLMVAVEKDAIKAERRLPMVRLLLDAGADPHATHEGKNLFQLAEPMAYDPSVQACLDLIQSHIDAHRLHQDTQAPARPASKPRL